MKWITTALFASTVLLANVLIETFGLVPVGFGLIAPAGVFAVGIALTLRDVVHEVAGVRWVVAAIIVGAALSAGLNPALAVASGAAFLLSELADLAVYAPLRRRHLAKGLVLSNAVGLVVDSAVFLWLAFGSLQFLPGQVVGKAYMTLLALPIIKWLRHRRDLAEALPDSGMATS